MPSCMCRETELRCPSRSVSPLGSLPCPTSRRLSDTVKISQSIKAAIVQTSPLPFELKVLEALLSGAAHGVHAVS